MKTTKYRIKISLAAKSQLDSLRITPKRRYPHLVPPSPTPRPPIAKRFHPNYVDNRSDSLRQAHLWSFNNRIVHVDTYLTDLQVAVVLAMALEHDVYAQRTHGVSEKLIPITNPNSITHHLLGQFLDAVILGYLIPTEAAYVA
jgi:hypothetical protein